MLTVGASKEALRPSFKVTTRQKAPVRCAGMLGESGSVRSEAQSGQLGAFPPWGP